MILALWRRWQRALANHGLGGTLVVGLRHLWLLLASLPRRIARLGQPPVKSLLDAQMGLDTDGVIDLSNLDIESPNWTSGFRYQPTPMQDFYEMLEHLDLDYPRYVFVDFGSGKGRAVLLAARFPFAAIVGVEFSPQLHQVALDNLRKFRAATDKGGNVRLELGDASQFPLPPEPGVYYFYNPFGADILGRVVENIRQSLIAAPRPCYLVYYNPVHEEVLAQAGFLERLVSHPEYAIYRNRP